MSHVLNVLEPKITALEAENAKLCDLIRGLLPYVPTEGSAYLRDLRAEATTTVNAR